MSRIYQRGNNWYLDVGTGKNRKRTSIGKSKKMAIEALRKASADIVYGKFNIEKQSNKKKIDETMETYASVISRTTKTPKLGEKNDRRVFKRFKELFCKLEYLEDIKLEHGEQYQAKRKGQKIKNSTINREITSLRAFLSYCVKHKYIREHPFKDLENLKEPKMVKPFLEVEEAFKLLETAKTTNQNVHVFIGIVLYAGLRLSEVLNLKWKDIDWKRKILTVQCDNDVRTKSNKYRPVALEEDLIAILQEHRRFNPFESEYIISSKGAKRVCIKKAYRNVLQRANLGKPATPRVLRTTCCSFWAMTGVPLKQAQLWMGHSDVKITAEIYSQIVPSLQGKYLNSISKLRPKELGTNLAQSEEIEKCGTL